MRVLFIDKDTNALSWIMRGQQWGYDISWIADERLKNQCVGKGIIKRNTKEDVFKIARKADLVILCSNDFLMDEADQLRQEGVPIIGPTKESAKLEIDRRYGASVMALHKMNRIEGEEFTNFDKAISYIKDTMGRYVSKPAGDNAHKELSYVSKGPADMIYMLEKWKTEKKIKGEFTLQEFVDGIEVGVSGWLGPKGFVGPWNENFEFKKLLNDDLGVNTGEQGTVIQYTAHSKLAIESLKRLEKFLVSTGHSGDIDINFIIGKDGKPYPLEFTARPGWPFTQIQFELIKEEEDPIAWCHDILSGRKVDVWNRKIAVGVVISIPDYPYNKFSEAETVGVPIYGLKSLKGYHPADVMWGTAPQEAGGKVRPLPCFLTAGDYLLVVTGSGESVSSAKRMAYNRIAKLQIPNSPGWRTDIGDRLRKQLPILQKHGYVTQMTMG